MQLTQNFSLAELTVSSWAKANGVSNEPTSEEHWANLRYLAGQLEIVRGILHHNPIRITSAYRNPRVNAAVGGVPNSAHAQALAADFTCPLFGAVTKVCKTIVDSGFGFDQLIWEYGRWVHLGFKPLGVVQRRQILTKHTGKPYSSGLPD